MPTRATAWQLRTRTLSLGPRPLLMGIVNVTPDSFSDGGRYFSRYAAMQHSLKLLDEGADILDIGGESTRPFSMPVTTEEELARVIPVIQEVVKRRPAVVISIDTSKSAVAQAALQAGAQIINDITALADPAMVELARTTSAAVCLMHMQGTPQSMQENPTYADVVSDIHAWLRNCRDRALAAGLDQTRLCLDPGIGFGKTHEHNIALMRSCWRFHDLECPLLVGHSRKAFIGKLIGNKEADRTAGTLGAALALARQGVQILRVHDVAAVKHALTLFEACGGFDGGDAWPMTSRQT